MEMREFLFETMCSRSTEVQLLPEDITVVHTYAICKVPFKWKYSTFTVSIVCLKS